MPKKNQTPKPDSTSIPEVTFTSTTPSFTSAEQAKETITSMANAISSGAAATGETEVQVRTVYNARPDSASSWKDDEDWHYCFVEEHPASWGFPSKIDKFQREMGYEIVSKAGNTAWMRIPQKKYQEMLRSWEEEAKRRWQRPKKDGIVEKHERREELAADMVARHRATLGTKDGSLP